MCSYGIIIVIVVMKYYCIIYGDSHEIVKTQIKLLTTKPYLLIRPNPTGGGNPLKPGIRYN